jgi:hypothetical protein
MVLILGGWLGWVAHQLRAQRRAVAWVNQVGWVNYEHQTVDGQLIIPPGGGKPRFKRDAKPAAPDWLRRAVGDEPFQTVVEVYFNKRGLTFDDAGLANLREFKHLRALSIGGTGLDDAGLARLRVLDQLQALSLAGTKVTDEGLVHLKGMPKLSTLDLSSTAVTDAGIDHLRDITRLSTLNLSGTSVTDIGLARLKELPKLRRLVLLAVGKKVSYTMVQELKAATPGLKVDYRPTIYENAYERVRSKIASGQTQVSIRSQSQTMIDRFRGMGREDEANALFDATDDALAGRPPQRDR